MAPTSGRQKQSTGALAERGRSRSARHRQRRLLAVERWLPDGHSMDAGMASRLLVQYLAPAERRPVLATALEQRAAHGWTLRWGVDPKMRNGVQIGNGPQDGMGASAGKAGRSSGGACLPASSVAGTNRCHGRRLSMLQIQVIRAPNRGERRICECHSAPLELWHSALQASCLLTCMACTRALKVVRCHGCCYLPVYSMSSASSHVLFVSGNQ